MQEILNKIFNAASILIGAVALRYLDLILKEYQPDIKKQISRIKKYFLFIASFIFPISSIALTFIFYKQVDKYFVGVVVANVAIILLALIGEVFKRNMKHFDFTTRDSVRRIESELDILKGLKSTMDIQEKQGEMVKQHNEMLKLLSDKTDNPNL